MENSVKRGYVYKTVEQEPWKRFQMSLGGSDIAQLTMLGCQTGIGAVPIPLKFGGDGAYQAWLVQDPALVPENYTLAARFEVLYDSGSGEPVRLGTWLKIFDDFQLVAEFAGHRISVYRADEYECLICIEK